MKLMTTYCPGPGGSIAFHVVINVFRSFANLFQANMTCFHLLSRYNFEQSLNALTNEVEGGDVEFLDFVYLLLEGPLEFANILEENDVVGESVALDTGLLDGLGTSVAWNPYWRQCGVCNPFLTPHYILHMDHYKEDAEVFGVRYIFTINHNLNLLNLLVRSQ